MLDKDTNIISIPFECGCKLSLKLFFHPNDINETLKRYNPKDIDDKLNPEICDKHRGFMAYNIFCSALYFHKQEQKEFNKLLMNIKS